MTDVIKNLDLDNPSEELKKDEATNSMRDFLTSSKIDHARTNAATLAMAFHEAIASAIHDYNDMLKDMSVADDGRVKDVQIIAALITLARGQAHAFSKYRFPSDRSLAGLAEIFLISEATDIAKDIAPDIGKTLLNMDDVLKAGIGFHKTKDGHLFGVIPKKKK